MFEDSIVYLYKLNHPSQKKLNVYISSIRVGDEDKLDITVRSGNKSIAPTWDMVNHYKQGDITEEKYTKQYINMMRKSFQKNKKRWLDLLKEDRVVLQYFCHTEWFCHRFTLAEILKKLGAEY